METNGKKLYTTHEVARFLGVTPITVIRWIEGGKFRCFTTVGGHRRIEHEELLRFTHLHNLPWFGEERVIPRVKDFLVLVLDDQEDIEDHFEDMAQFLPDVRHVRVWDPFSAGAKLAEEKPDLILLSLMLPGLNAFDFCSFVKRDFRFQSIPFVCIATDQNSADPEKLREFGLLDVMIRPFATPYLVKRIEAYRGPKPHAKAA